MKRIIFLWKCHHYGQWQHLSHHVTELLAPHTSHVTIGLLRQTFDRRLNSRSVGAIWHHWTIFCGVPLKNSVMPWNQKQFSIWRLIFVMLLPRNNPIHLKKCTKIKPIEWGTVRPAMAAIWIKYLISNRNNSTLQQKNKKILLKISNRFSFVAFKLLNGLLYIKNSMNSIKMLSYDLVMIFEMVKRFL